MWSTQATLQATRELPPELVRGGGGMDSSASDAAAALAACGVDISRPIDLVRGVEGVRLPRRRVSLAAMLATTAEAVATATPRVTAASESAALSLEAARASGTPAQAAQVREGGRRGMEGEGGM